MLNIRQLETFYWDAKLGRFTAAAARLNTTQAAISMRVHEPESTLGIALFDRHHRAVIITSKESELLGYAEQILRLSSEAPLRIGSAEVVSITWLPSLIRAIHASHPLI